MLGLWVALGQAGAQPSSCALALLVLSSRGDCCPSPGRTVPHVAPRVSSHPGDDPDSKAFPGPAGAGSGPAPSQEVPSLCLARPLHGPGSTEGSAGLGDGLDPGKQSGSLPAGPCGGHSPAQRANAPGML